MTPGCSWKRGNASCASERASGSERDGAHPAIVTRTTARPILIEAQRRRSAARLAKRGASDWSALLDDMSAIFSVQIQLVVAKNGIIVMRDDHNQVLVRFAVM